MEALARSLGARATMRASRGDHEGATADIRRAIELPDAPVHVIANILMMRAHLLKEAGDADGALEEISRAIDLAQSYPAILSSGFIFRGNLRIARGDLDGAVEDLVVGVSNNDPNAPPDVMVDLLFISIIQRGDPSHDDVSEPLSIDQLTQIADLPNLSPHSTAMSRFVRGKALMLEGRIEEALQDLNRVIDMGDAPPDILMFATGWQEEVLKAIAEARGE